MVRFLGRLGGQFKHQFAHLGLKNELDSDSLWLSWDSEHRLFFNVPFTDMKAKIPLDPIIPRVLELAKDSSDRQTKVIACEFLHSLVLYLLGKNARPISSLPESTTRTYLTPIYHKVLPTLLILACDVESVATQLFQPLVFQMIHWFTNNRQAELEETGLLLKVIMDGVSHPTNSTLRDFSARCINEYLVWSIKQSSPQQIQNNPFNVKALFKYIYGLALHPAANKRIGAALAITNIYRVFRENNALVDQFIIEVTVVFLKSLRLSHHDEPGLAAAELCDKSLEHLQRIIVAKVLHLNPPYNA